jgi:hypothetical protein
MDVGGANVLLVKAIYGVISADSDADGFNVMTAPRLIAAARRYRRGDN